jgi:hypothetical protein
MALLYGRAGRLTGKTRRFPARAVSTKSMPEGYSQFFSHGEGARVWDVDGKEYIDFMCTYGPPRARSHSLSLCTAAHPLHTGITNIICTSISEAAMRPDPRPDLRGPPQPQG